MLKKLEILLTRPKAIAYFYNEKMKKSLFLFFFLYLLALTPFLVSLMTTKSLRVSSYNYVASMFMDANDEFENKFQSLKISDYEFKGDNNLIYESAEAYIFLNPTNKYNNLNLGISTAIVDFRSNHIEVRYLNIVLFNKTYEELKIKDLDFGKIIHHDYKELDLYYDILDQIFNELHTLWVLKYYVSNLIFLYLFILISAFLMSLIFYIYRPQFPMKMRFKIAYDSQAITIFMAFIGMLTGFNFILYVGLFMSMIYYFMALKSIIAIKITKKGE